MEEIKIKFNDSLMPGLIISLVSIVLGLAMQFVIDDLEVQQKLGFLSFAVILGMMIYFGIQFRNNMGDAGLPFGKAFVYFLYMMIIYSVVSLIFTYVNYAFINPELIEKILEATYNKLSEQGLSETEIENAIAMQEKFMTPGWMTFWFSFTMIFISAILALISAAIVQRKPKITFE